MFIDQNTREVILPSNISFMSRRQVKLSNVPVKIQFPGAGQQPVISVDQERYTLKIVPPTSSR